MHAPHSPVDSTECHMKRRDMYVCMSPLWRANYSPVVSQAANPMRGIATNVSSLKTYETYVLAMSVHAHVYNTKGTLNSEDSNATSTLR